MINLNWTTNKNSNARSVALGTFDGVHLGHRELLKQAILKKPDKGTSAVLTFDLPPEQFFNNKRHFLASFPRKVELITQAGIEEVAWLDFTKEVANLSAQDFIKLILVEKLQVKEVICGFNFRFGHGREGDLALLRQAGSEYGFGVTVVSPIQAKTGQVISSTAIRNFLREGELDLATEYLGYFISYKGEVVEGYGRGRKLGFPTANLEIDQRLVIPSEGVYLTALRLPSGKLVKSLTSIGKNPTFQGEVQTVESFILDFSQKLYGETLEITFVKRLRDIIKFNSVQELQVQIEKDLEQVKGFRLQDLESMLE